MHFHPSHLSHGARHNPAKKDIQPPAGAKTKGAKAPTKATAKSPAKPPSGGHTKLNAEGKRRLRAALNQRAKQRHANQRAARAAQLNVPTTAPAAQIPVATDQTTLLTPEEIALWSETGEPLPSDAELLSELDEGELLLDTTSTLEVEAPEEPISVGKYIIAAVGAVAAAAFFLN
jgi:hypothetical protein